MKSFLVGFASSFIAASVFKLSIFECIAVGALCIMFFESLTTKELK